MIQAKELRIGNLVYHKNNAEPGLQQDEWAINWVGSYDIATSIDYPQNYKPIPLTPGILEACGFKWAANIHRWVHGCGYRLIQHNYGFDSGIGDGSFLQPPLKYLHQLQNLFFTLTGSELTVNIKELV
jgi:hypothetical protein